MTERQPVDLPNFRQQIGTYEIGEVKVPIYFGMRVTVERAREFLDTGKLVKSYSYITGDTRLALPMRAVKEAMLGEVQLGWYRLSGTDIPAKVMSTQEDRMAKAQATTAATEEATAAATPKAKEPRITNRSIIENGLLTGKTVDDIVKEVKQHFPNGKADSKHVAYYRHFLEKTGKLEKIPKVKKEKPAKAEKGAEPAPAAEQKTVAAAPAQANVGRSATAGNSKGKAVAGKK